MAELLEPLTVVDEPDVTTFAFRLPGFHRQRERRRGTRGDAATTPFDFGAFKWCLEVHVSGNGPCAGTHVSAFVALVTPVPREVSVLLPFSLTAVRTDGGDPGTHMVKGDAEPGALAHAFSPATSVRVGWPDFLPLSRIPSFLDSDDGLMIHLAMGKPARCCFTHPIARAVLGANDLFDTPGFKLGGHTWFLRIHPYVDTGTEPYVSMHVVMEEEEKEEEDWALATSGTLFPAYVCFASLPVAAGMDHYGVVLFVQVGARGRHAGKHERWHHILRQCQHEHAVRARGAAPSCPHRQWVSAGRGTGTRRGREAWGLPAPSRRLDTEW